MRALIAALACAAAVAAAAVAPASAQAEVPERWDTLSREIAAPWPGLQDDNGRYRDYLDRFYPAIFAYTRYGESWLGYALLQTGVRDREPALVTSGLKAIRWVLTREEPFFRRPSVFEHMAMASAYNFARENLADHPDFVAVRARWESWLRTLEPLSTFYRRPNTSRYSNHYLIEAIAVLELLRSGLRSSRSDAILGGQRATVRRLTLRLLNTDVPRRAAADVVRTAGQRTYLFSDPPDQPLAYHGFSAGFYARALELLDDDASSRARGVLREIANASVELTAPDGDLSYYGRGQADVWAHSTAALGAEAAALLPGSGASRDAAYRAVTERALARMRDLYGNGPGGLWVTPALKQDLDAGVRGTDGATGGPSFAGVALVTLNWALEEMAGADERRIGRLGSDSDGTAQLSLRRGRFAVVRRGDLWYAVRRTGSTRAFRDLRNDFGLVALKARSGAAWEDVLRQRPRTTDDPDSAGPVLRRGGSRYLPEGRDFRVSSGGTVTIDGGYRTARGRIVRTGARFVFRPVACGVRATWTTRRGERFEYSVFFAQRPEVSGQTITGGNQRVSIGGRASVDVEGGYASGTDARLWRARISFAASDGGARSVTVCRA